MTITFDKATLKEALREVMQEIQPVTSTVTISQAARMLGVSDSQVRALIAEGSLSVKYDKQGEKVRPLRVTVESISSL